MFYQGCFTVSFSQRAASECNLKILALLWSSCCIVMKLVLYVYSKIKFVTLQRTLNSFFSAWAEKLEFLLTRTSLVAPLAPHILLRRPLPYDQFFRIAIFDKLTSLETTLQVVLPLDIEIWLDNLFLVNDEQMRHSIEYSSRRWKMAHFWVCNFNFDCTKNRGGDDLMQALTT